MDIKSLQRDWEKLGAEDPLYWVLTWREYRGGKWDQEKFFRLGEEEIERLFAYFPALGVDPKRGTALDFGCGVGRLTQPLARRFDKAYGVDISAPMVERAREFNKLGEKCEFVVNTRPDLSVFPDGRFDLIYSNITLQHMTPRLSAGYIRDFFRLLAPGGLAVFFLPSHRRQPRKDLGRKIKDAFKRHAPGLLKRAYYQVTRGGEPRVEMHGTRLATVADYVERARVPLTLVDVRTDGSAGDKWVGYRYCIRRD